MVEGPDAVKVSAKVTTTMPTPPPGPTRDEMVALAGVLRERNVGRLDVGVGSDDKAMKYRGKVYKSKTWRKVRKDLAKTTSRRTLELRKSRIRKAIHVGDVTESRFELRLHAAGLQLAKWTHEQTPWWGGSSADNAAVRRQMSRFLAKRFDQG